MKRITTLFALLLVFSASVFAQAPSPKEITDAYIEAIGGADAWLKMEAIQMKGKASMQGMEMPFVMTTAKGNKFHQIIDVQGQQIIQSFDGSSAWQVMPFMGITEPTPMSDEEAAQLKEQVFLPEFINSEARGFKVEAVDGKEVEGTPTYGLRVTNEEGIDHTYYFDTEYLIPIMMASTIKSGPQKGAVIETFMSDYQEIEDVVVPMFMEMKVNGQSFQKITISETNLNPEVDVKMFFMPEK
jgi:outer membrane lipoprotein-sorting protein